jgi:hypothetical protein
MKRILLIGTIAAALASTALVGAPAAAASGPTVGIGGAGTCLGSPKMFYGYPYQYYGPFCRVVNWGNSWNIRGFYAYSWSGQYLGYLECKSAFGVPETCYMGYWNP